ncbi:molybdenum cofactor guanylyltransferase [Natranaerobius trueperi]|uniref:Probable molybdenum cofactor guanylyltransferase n=1 Tax=Natranaerobius trueperi TaxID=759412 RepID=A0A226BX21_9FIRM|nr:molybdenum cofactor guanylyltransferase [Natranaerobius trueperi]OWZ83588.1 hypothetical protein CDO51_07705 [Natranaerobius trueperi]
MRSTAIVLAGGESKRMGTDKIFLELNKKRIIDFVLEITTKIFKETIIVSNNCENFNGYSVKTIKDKMNHLKKSSLRGIYSGLSEIDSEYGFVIGGDMPFINSNLIEAMVGQIEENAWDVVIPKFGKFYEPLFAIYHKSCLSNIKQQLLSENHRIVSFFSTKKVLTLSKNYCKQYDPDLISFFNVNTPSQLEIARRYLDN